MGPELLVGTVGLAAFVKKAIDFLRMVTNVSTQVSGIVTQLCTWVAGIVATSLFAHTDLANTITIGTQTLDKYNGATLTLIGMVLASGGSLLHDIQQAIDQSDSAVKPPLLKR